MFIYVRLMVKTKLSEWIWGKNQNLFQEISGHFVPKPYRPGMMGAGAYGSSGVTPPLVAHLWKTYALPRMVYGLEVFNLSNKDILQLEQLQRTVLRQIQSFPINTSLVAVYSLLGVRPIEQELDLRKLTFLGSVLLNKGTL